MNDLCKQSASGLNRLTYYEFFAGGGMARIGLGDVWNCLFSNDFDPKKVEAYRANFSDSAALKFADVRAINAADLPERASLAWASFPCQDLSLAGAGSGLGGERSGTFWSFLNLMLDLKAEGRHPSVIVLENVAGLITSHKGSDLQRLIMALINSGYRVGAFLINASMFVPQSRARLFVVGIGKENPLPDELIGAGPDRTWHTSSLLRVVKQLPNVGKDDWLWLRLPAPEKMPSSLEDLVEDSPKDVLWHSSEETRRLLDMMSPPNRAKVHLMARSGKRAVGTIYKRTRNGVQRAEVRFDGVSGCLRTPTGGSSRQILMVVEGESVRSRLISSRETARLMGLPDNYVLPQKYNDAYHLTGDGVVVPVVAWLEQHLIRPIILNGQQKIERLQFAELELA